ncbi:MAG: ABC transporter ATP-binding protein [Candidatus Njordarchaeia archaeon]
MRVEGVVKIYRSGEISTVALRELNMDVRSGEFRIIAGPSGSGKTTLLNILGAIDTPDAGKVFVNGEDITKFDKKKRIEYRVRKVGFIFQFFNLVPYLTALENVMIPMHLVNMSREEKIKRAKELLKAVDLGDRMHHKPSELSGGEQQRVAIAIALANDPPLILADEPTGELDFSTSRQIVKLFQRLHKELNKTIIMVTHDIAMALYADRISIMRDGSIIETVSPAEKRIAELLLVPNEEEIVSLENRKKMLLEEIKRVEREYKEGKITLDELVDRYESLKRELKKVEEDLKKFSF